MVSEAAIISQMNELVVIQQCVSLTPWFMVKVASKTTPGITYRVLRVHSDDTIEELCCECEGFIHRGVCSHQAIAHAKMCNWTSLTGIPQTKEQERNLICPECSRPTEKVTAWV